jgi:spore germination protein GerM
MTRLPLIAAAIFVALGLAACGGGGEATPVGEVPTAELPTSPEPTTPADPTGPAETEPSAPGETDPPTTEPAEETFTYEVWLTQGESLYLGTRTAPKTPRVATTAMQSLLEGPSPAEAVAAVGTAIPDGTQLLGVTVAEGLATVDLSSEFESGGGTLSMTMRLAQVVYTLTQFPTVKGVNFKLDGQPVEVFSGEGIILDHPVTREDYEDLRPIIAVVEPQSGARITSPVRISGTANVFEANVSAEVLDAEGNVIAQAFTTATCGTGCWGDYELELSFDVSTEQPGTIVVHDDDAAGTGTPPHVVNIPVTLVP